MSDETFEHLGAYSDWVRVARQQMPPRPEPRPGPELRRRLCALLGFTRQPAGVRAIRVERTWERDGVTGEEVSWSVGYGPRTVAWVLRPSTTRGALPAVVALHSHDGVKYWGKEKVADGPDEAPLEISQLRERGYGGEAFANALARRGFVVLAHDVFLWGSRRFALDTMPAAMRARSDVGTPGSADHYNAVARDHEHLVAKYCAILGTSLAGVVAYEDRAAVAYLGTRPEVLPGRIGCIGLSGGGCRAALLQATCDDVAASVIVGMMSTYGGLLDRHVHAHTWMFLPAGLAAIGDWPDLAAARAPAPLLVQYNREDRLFSLSGMQAAHARIAAHYQATDRPDAYRGEFYGGDHKFDRPMQAAAFDWLGRVLT